MRVAAAHYAAIWSAVSLTDGGTVWTFASDGRSMEEPVSEGTLASHVFSAAPDGLVVREAPDDPRFTGHPWLCGGPGRSSLFGVVIALPDGVSVGSLVVCGVAPSDSRDTSELGVLHDLAGLLADVIQALGSRAEFDELRSEVAESRSEVTSARHELARLTASDPLTGLLNRRALQERLDASLALARRTGHGMALAILDIDGFKDVNERFGAGVADALLMRVADALDAVVRDHDFVARVGADEFVVLWQAIGPEGALVAAERTLHTVNRSFELVDAHEPGSVVIETSVSLGFACFPLDAEDGVGLLRAADVAMYQAKRQGGCVRRYEQPS